MSDPLASPPPAPPGGPYVTAAVLCERVLTEQDGVLSFVRIVDRVTHAAIGPSVAEVMPPVPVNLTAAILLKSGQARGRYTVKLTLEAPSGLDVGETVELPVLLEGEDRGVNLLVSLGFQAEQEGLYWFNVRFGEHDVLLTRMPLRIIYQPQRVGGQPTG